MKWIEIIELRSVGKNRSSLEMQLLSLINQIKVEEKFPVIKLYENGIVETDFCIHLIHDTEITDLWGSLLGYQLTSAFMLTYIEAIISGDRAKIIRDTATNHLSHALA